MGDKTCFCSHFGGAKALFSYINLQATDSVGGQNHAKCFIWGGAKPHCPLQMREWKIPEPSSILSGASNSRFFVEHVAKV